MARARAQKDLLSRVSDLGTEVVQRLADIPGGQRVVELANESKTRLDEMQKKLRGLDELEKRVAKLERQFAAQSKPAAKKPAAKTSASTRSSSAARRSAKKPSA
jgi:uncharacterized membrane protein YccC